MYKYLWLLIIPTLLAADPEIRILNQNCSKKEKLIMVQATITNYSGKNVKCTYSYKKTGTKRSIDLIQDEENTRLYWGLLPLDAQPLKLGVEDDTLDYDIIVDTGEEFIASANIDIRSDCNHSYTNLSTKQEEALQKLRKLPTEVEEEIIDGKRKTALLWAGGIAGTAGVAGAVVLSKTGKDEASDRPTEGSLSINAATTGDNGLFLNISQDNPVYNQSISIPANQSTAAVNVTLDLCINLIGSPTDITFIETDLIISFTTQTDSNIFTNWSITEASLNNSNLTASRFSSSEVLIKITTENLNSLINQSHAMSCPNNATLSISGTVSKVL